MLMLPFVAQLLYRFLSDLDYVSPFLSFLQTIYEIQNSAISLSTALRSKLTVCHVSRNNHPYDSKKQDNQSVGTYTL